MSEVEHLVEELREANKNLNPCICGGRVKIAYSPGVTVVWCPKEKEIKACLPDWAPTRLAEGWNDGTIKPPTKMELLMAKARAANDPF